MLDRKRFQSDVLWNLGSLVVLGVSGIALNSLIGIYYDAATLGVFNQTLAAYIFFSQLAVGGIHFSLLKEVAAHKDKPQHVSTQLLSALVPTFALAAIATLLFYASRHLIAAWLDSPLVAPSMAMAAPGLFLFALNKVLLATVNGLQRMRAHALYQSLRYIGILVALLLALVWKFRPEQLSYVWSFSETLLFLALMIDLGRHVWGAQWQEWRSHARHHLHFGVKSAWSGMLMELNSRVDVLMLGHFSNDSVVGVYSFAAMLFEGCYQIFVVLQNNYNPIMAQLYARQDLQNLRTLIARGRRNTYLAALPLGAIAVALYPIALRLLTNKPEFAESSAVFAALIAGLVAAAGYLPFQSLLLMTGFPGWHSVLLGSTVLINVTGNALLIPHWGAVGSAAATSFALLCSCVMWRCLAWRFAGLRNFG